jgi:hypothetical protein
MSLRTSLFVGEAGVAAALPDAGAARSTRCVHPAPQTRRHHSA